MPWPSCCGKSHCTTKDAETVIKMIPQIDYVTLKFWRNSNVKRGTDSVSVYFNQPEIHHIQRAADYQTHCVRVAFTITLSSFSSFSRIAARYCHDSWVCGVKINQRCGQYLGLTHLDWRSGKCNAEVQTRFSEPHDRVNRILFCKSSWRLAGSLTRDGVTLDHTSFRPQHLFAAFDLVETWTKGHYM